jgi:hypothetical protein
MVNVLVLFELRSELFTLLQEMKIKLIPFDIATESSIQNNGSIGKTTMFSPFSYFEEVFPK